MMKLIVLIVAAISCISAKPGHLSRIIAAPAPVVTAQSSQVFARNFNGLVPFAPVPVPLPVPAPIVAAPIPAAPILPFPSRVVTPFLPPRVVSPFVPYAPYPYYPYAPLPRPIFY
ncbi:CLUMA_CG009332, isoform A [Clunio marinus]|uniref:CLUMA_CG009332, isoform A n=1 Tax=Clunio marinus TaxID=568069 RepID=A0A1J1IAA5_9DIPT|nr:CLUMA_CG009332, isoform A [Clunio marinus]